MTPPDAHPRPADDDRGATTVWLLSLGLLAMATSLVLGSHPR